jgi:predicted dehydrogenase
MQRRTFIRNTSLAALAAAAGWRANAEALTPARPLRVAQLGTAHAHAREKWATLKRLPDHFECVALCEPDAGERRKAEADPEFAGANWISEEALFSHRDLDAILVETELPDLLYYGERVIEAGWHLHIDKPPGRDLTRFKALQDAAISSRRVLQQGYMYRYHPAMRFCLDAAERGWLGRIFAIQGEIGKVIAPGRREWLAENYGGSMMLLGCHLIDITVALLGTPSRVTGYRRNTFPDRDKFLDHEFAVLEYDGAIATIRSLLAEVEGEARRQFVVCGENATIEIMPLEPARVRVAFQSPPEGFVEGYQEVKLPAVDARYGSQLIDFARMVRGETSEIPQFDSGHDLRVHETLLQTTRI